MISAAHITVIGTVQGVAFRYHTQLKAQELGIQGKVRNEKDGSVTVIAEGTEMSIFTFIEWCHNGPPSADVQELDYHYTTPKPYHGFVIER